MGEMTILRPIFGRGVARRWLGAEVPEVHQNSVMLGFKEMGLLIN